MESPEIISDTVSSHYSWHTCDLEEVLVLNGWTQHARGAHAKVHARCIGQDRVIGGLLAFVVAFFLKGER